MNDTATADLFSGSLVQQGLSIIPRARRSDPVTSHSAAESMVQGAARHRVTILNCLALFGPQTIYEIAARTGLTAVQVARRTADLHDQKTIERIKTGTYKLKDLYQTRLSPNGTACCVWRVVQ